MTYHLVALLCLSVGAAPAFATQYPCPNDPGFCYLDIGNDGCFEQGVDTGPIDNLLASGSFPAPGPHQPGSIVCPPEVGSLVLSSNVRWSTAPGASVLLYNNKIRGPGLTVTSGDRILLAPKLLGLGLVELTAEGDIDIRASILNGPPGIGRLSVTSASGGISVGPRVKLQASAIDFLASGDIELLDRVHVRGNSQGGGPLAFETPGTLTATNLTASSVRQNRLVFDVQNLHLRGRTKANLFGMEAYCSGLFEADRIISTSDRDVTIIAGTIRIGTPDPNGKVKTSKIRTARNIDLTATGDVSLSRVKLLDPWRFLAPRPIDVVAGGDVSITDSLVRAFPVAIREVNVSTDPGFTCDISGSKFSAATPSLNCDILIGP